MMSVDLSGFGKGLPLICDLDGTLIKTDSLHENFLSAFFHSPLELLRSVPQWFSGRAALKGALAGVYAMEPQAFPYCEDVLKLVKAAKAEGRAIFLVTAADQSIADKVVSHLGDFDGAKGSDGQLNLKSHNKLEWLQSQFPDGFIYAGDSAADLPIWNASAGAILVGDGAKYAHRLREAGVEVRTLRPDTRSAIKGWMSELRLHQWSKNLLIFVPLILGHIATDIDALLRTFFAFIAFGLVASATYVINDLADLGADRAHPTKRHRAIAAGNISVLQALLACMFLLAAGLGVAAILSLKFAAAVLVYLALTLAYSFSLKKVALIDVTVIGALFTLRIVMGQVLNNLAPSPWLLSFSALFFFSLALAKRHVEVMRVGAAGQKSVKGRDYLAGDWPLTLGFGLASAAASIVVMILFVALEGGVVNAYSHPVWLYVAPACVFIWLQRVWLLSHRMQLNDDPIVFALRDKPSYLLGLIVAIGFVLAL